MQLSSVSAQADHSESVCDATNVALTLLIDGENARANETLAFGETTKGCTVGRPAYIPARATKSRASRDGHQPRAFLSDDRRIFCDFLQCFCEFARKFYMESAVESYSRASRAARIESIYS